jgi:hypothetical protein
MNLTMRIFLLIILGLMSLSVPAQHSLIYDVPNTPELLKKNKVKEIHIRELTDETFKITHKYFISEGLAYEHHYYDPYFLADGSVREKSWLAKDTAGLVYYQREIFDENGVLKLITHRYVNLYSKGKRLLYSDQMENTEYISLRKIKFDTLHSDYTLKTEYRLLNNDTLFMIYDEFNGVVKTHSYKTKTNGKWQENEKSVSVFENDVLIEYYQYSFGKLTDSYTKYEADKLIEKKGTDDLGYEDYGLPVPDPVTEVFYVNDKNIENIQEVNKTKAKFRLEVYYFQGKNSDPSYSFYDNKTGLIHTKFGKNKNWYTEFLYVME